MRPARELGGAGSRGTDNKFTTVTEQTDLQQLCVQSGKLISGLIRSPGDR